MRDDMSDTIATPASEPELGCSRSAAPSSDLANGFLHPEGVPHLLRKALAFMPLNAAQREELRGSTERPTSVPADTFLHRRGDPVRRVVIVVSGALIESVAGPDGGTQNLRFYFPGDSIGGHEIALRHHAADLRTLTPVRYGSVPAHAVAPRANARVLTLFYALRLAEQAIMSDRMRTIGRGRADERILHLMLELNARQRLTEPSVGNRVWCPFSQAEIGDAVGLTNVYVSRTVTRLREEGVLWAEGRCFTIADPAAAARRTGFVNRYADIDLTRMSPAAT